MNALAERVRRMTPLELGMSLSLALHLVMAASAFWRDRVIAFNESIDPMEIDLTRPFRLVDDPAKAKKAVNPGAGAPRVEKTSLLPGQGVVGGSEEAGAAGKTPVQDWKLPDPATRQDLQAPADAAPAGRPDGQGEGAGVGGLGGTGDGEVDLIYLTALPKLINKNELLRNIQRFYPEEDRRLGREGRVVLNVHIDRDGRVRNVGVTESGGTSFDQAALKVLSRARFSPAKVGDKSVPVKIPQSIDFLLE